MLEMTIQNMYLNFKLINHHMIECMMNIEELRKRKR